MGKKWTLKHDLNYIVFFLITYVDITTAIFYFLTPIKSTVFCSKPNTDPNPKFDSDRNQTKDQRFFWGRIVKVNHTIEWVQIQVFQMIQIRIFEFKNSNHV